MKITKFIISGFVILNLVLCATIYFINKETHEDVNGKISIVCYNAVLLTNETSIQTLKELSDESFNSLVKMVNEFSPDVMAKYVMRGDHPEEKQTLDLLKQDKEKALKKLKERSRSNNGTSRI